MPSIRSSMAPRAWVRLASGRRIDLLNPSPLDFEDEDIAIGLSRTPRWGGHSVWEWPLSVAQHSIQVLELAKARSPQGLAVPLQRAALLHDASEGLMAFDPISPVKPFLGPGYQALDARLQAAIHVRYGLPASLPADWIAMIKDADKASAAAEARHVAGWTVQEIRQALGITARPPAEDPLARRYGCTPWEPWPARTAAEHFRAALAALGPP
ncbi:phosphohydrolase [Vineibacter terrae]|uniref:Phosphohydrolase n=1 Tax=Vineibacter terrae TaxID=2586908 RepID=A0A5C8PUD0_9HYPH|nr:phosphohydrolase [Vineibacter terrae]TXL81694.1 phosphohydrolase [Vineibacter terrae]